MARTSSSANALATLHSSVDLFHAVDPWTFFFRFFNAAQSKESRRKEMPIFPLVFSM